jgi:hypothetical protein
MLETIGAVERKGVSSIKINYYPFQGMPFLMDRHVKFPSEKFLFWFKEFNLPL